MKNKKYGIIAYKGDGSSKIFFSKRYGAASAWVNGDPEGGYFLVEYDYLKKYGKFLESPAKRRD
jgi:hypothetical protein